MNTGTNLPYNPNLQLQPEQPGRDPKFVMLTPEDIQATKECMREGIFKAGLPFAFGVTFLTSYLFKIGVLRNPPSLASKVLTFPFSTFCGYFIFYSPFCKKMLKDRIEGRQNSEFQGQYVLLPNQDTPIESSETSFDTITGSKSVESESYFSPLNLDYESSFQAQEASGLQDDTKRIRETTYDDLRKKNRENYQRQLYKLYEPKSDKSGNEFHLEDSKNTEFKVSESKNKYGDYME